MMEFRNSDVKLIDIGDSMVLENRLDGDGDAFRNICRRKWVERSAFAGIDVVEST